MCHRLFRDALLKIFCRALRCLSALKPVEILQTSCFHLLCGTRSFSMNSTILAAERCEERSPPQQTDSTKGLPYASRTDRSSYSYSSQIGPDVLAFTTSRTRSPSHFFADGAHNCLCLFFSPGENLEGRVRSTAANPPPTKPATLIPTTTTTPTSTLQRPMALAPSQPPKKISQKSALARPPFHPPCCLTPSRYVGGRWRRGTAFGVRPSRPRPSENYYFRLRSPTTPKNWRVWTW